MWNRGFCRNGEEFTHATFAETAEVLFGIDELTPVCFEFSQGEEGLFPAQQTGCSNLDYLRANGLDVSGPFDGLAFGTCQYFDSGAPALRCG